jgi:hypothetical protein
VLSEDLERILKISITCSRARNFNFRKACGLWAVCCVSLIKNILFGFVGVYSKSYRKNFVLVDSDKLYL